ncbi:MULTISPECIES: hypothetical protein [unclassified Brevundimonas]|uniref:hypothetical protein n=1 Tax=unclassified Brevundimonas TaxID=2622653 RepID=UPI0025C11003|nr:MULTISPECIES: hypothetical protein [unclassified Brevundimonas]
MADTLSTPQNDNGERSWEEALEEAINLFEQGENIDSARFAELVEELKQRHVDGAELPQDDPRVSALAALQARATALETSAAEGTGPTDQVSSILGGLVGQPSNSDAPAVVEVEGLNDDEDR